MKTLKHPLTKVLLGFGAAVLLGIATASGQTYSHARVVRLSFVEGQVTMQRPDVSDWAEAPVNTPIQEGFKLATAEGGFAEVEFENGSTMRLGQLSMLEFTQLGLASDGSKINRLTIDKGYATLHVAPEAEDVYEVLASIATLTPRGKAMFRVDADSSEERVEVFKGSVQVESSLGTWTMEKNSVLDLAPDADQSVQLSEGITEDEWDHWVEDRESRVESASNGPSPGAYTNSDSNTFYGWSDLTYYGNWSLMPGYGYGWIPNVNAGWSPYSIGRWCWYPGFGFTWISYDPWGWLPYHYGGWNFIPGIGWMWFPGSFAGWSPGLVTWYGGPGWIGWVPRTGRINGANRNPCPQGQACGTAVSSNVFRSGRPVGPGTILSVKPESGEQLDRPDVSPAREAMLPGRIVTAPARMANSNLIMVGTRGAPRPATLAPGAVAGSSRPAGAAPGLAAGRAAPGPGSGIAYDPAAGRYVNDSRSAPAATPAPGEPSVRHVPLNPGASQDRGSTLTPRGNSAGGLLQSSPRSNPGSAAAPRTGVVMGGGQPKAGSGSTGSGSSGGAARSGGGSWGGGGGGGGSRGGGSSGGGGGGGGGSHGGGGGSGGGGGGHR